MSEGPAAQAAARARALDHLYQGQSNDCYWHGLFADLHRPHAHATLSHLIAAEDLADAAEAAGGGRPYGARLADTDWTPSTRCWSLQRDRRDRRPERGRRVVFLGSAREPGGPASVVRRRRRLTTGGWSPTSRRPRSGDRRDRGRGAGPGGSDCGRPGAAAAAEAPRTIHESSTSRSPAWPRSSLRPPRAAQRSRSYAPCRRLDDSGTACGRHLRGAR